MTTSGWPRTGAQITGRTAKACRGVAAVAAVVMLVRVIQTMVLFNNTVDEPFHIASAVVMYDTGKEGSGVEQPPLTRIVAGLPLYLRGVRLPPAELTTSIVAMPETYLQGARILFGSNLSYRQVLLTSRLGMLLFPLVALLYLYLLAAWIGNEFIAASAALLFSLDPTLLGHSTWVCTDVAACAGFLAATYHGERWLALGGRKRAVVTGMAVALAIAAKFSCLFVIPVIALLMIVQAFTPVPDESAKTPRAYLRHWPPVSQMAIAAAVALITLWGTYFFNIDRMSNQSMFTDAQSAFQKLPLRLRNAEIPMPSFPLGVMRLVSHNKMGNRNYLNGAFSSTGHWYYFPEAIALKEPLALLAGLLAAGLLLFVPSYRATWQQTAAILIPPAVVLLAAMKGNFEIGIRHVLPVLPFLYLWVCFQLTRAKAAGLTLLAVLTLVAAAESVWISPNYAEFFNLPAGGPARGAQYLIDSNIDWGQDVARLADWLHSDQARGRSYSLRLFMFPDKSLCRTFGLDPAAVFRNSDSGLLAISKNVRYGLGAGMTEDWVERPNVDYSWLSAYPIVKQIGYSIDVYDLDAPLHRRSTR